MRALGAILGTLALLPATAAGAELPYVWRTSQPTTAHAEAPMVCPSKRLCAAAGGHTISTSRTPTKPRSWQNITVDPQSDLTTLSCPTASLCVGGDRNGDVVASTDPAGPAAAWTVVKVVPGARAINAIDCPSPRLCVAVDAGGDIATSTDPAGGAAGWIVRFVDSEPGYECGKYGGDSDCFSALDGVSCPRLTLCVAVDESQDVLVSHDPSTNPAHWSISGRGGLIPAYNAVTCPTVSFCATTDGDFGDVITFDPAHPDARHTTRFGAGVGDVACPSARLCFVAAGDTTSRLFFSTNPASASSNWFPTRGTYSIATCRPAWCLAIAKGALVVGDRLPSPRALRALLTRALRRLAGGSKTVVAAPTAGTLTLRLRQGRHLTMVARATASRPRRVRLMLGSLPRGNFQVTLAFKPSGHRAVTVVYAASGPGAG